MLFLDFIVNKIFDVIAQLFYLPILYWHASLSAIILT